MTVKGGPPPTERPSLGSLEPTSRLKLAEGTIYLPGCWLAHHGRYERGEMPPCDGAPTKAHLIPQRVLRRVVPRTELWAFGTWVWACGGPTGAGGHHAMFDVARTIRVPRSEIPESTEEFAIDWNLGWYLCREYGCRDTCRHSE